MSLKSFLKEKLFGEQQKTHVEEKKPGQKEVVKEILKKSVKKVKDPARLNRKDGAEDAMGQFHTWFDWHLQYAQGCRCTQALQGEAKRK